MSLTRLLLATTGGGSLPPTPVAVIRNIVASIPDADGYVYQLNDGFSVPMDVLKVIDDGAGGYLAVSHNNLGTGHFEIRLSTSSDLENWAFTHDLTQSGNGPSIARRSDGSFVVAFTDEGATWRVRVRRYANLSDLLTNTYTDNVLLPWTLASGGGAEQFPNILSADDPTVIGFVWNDGTGTPGVVDHDAIGTLTGLSGTSYTSWATTDQTARQSAITDLGAFAVGDFDTLTYQGQTLTFVEAQTYTGVYGAFHVYYWDGTLAVEQSITTHGGSTEFGNPSLSILESPTNPGAQVLAVGLYLPYTGAAAGENGPALYWKQLP